MASWSASTVGRLFQFRPNRIQIRAEHRAALKRRKESRSDGPPRLNIAAPMQATDNTALAVNAPARQDTARTLWDQRRKRQRQGPAQGRVARRIRERVWDAGGTLYAERCVIVDVGAGAAVAVL